MGKILLKGGTVLSVDPQIGDLPTGDVLIDGDTIAGVEAEHRCRRRGRGLHGQNRHPGLRGHAPAHVGGGDPQLRPQRHARRLLRGGARHLRPALPAGGRLRQQRRRVARVPQRRDHDPRGLVPHQQHSRPPGRCHRWPAGDRHPRAVRLRQRQHLARRSTGSSARRRSPATTCGASARGTSPPTAVCSPWAWPPGGRGSPRTRWSRPSGAWPASSASPSPCTSAWAGWRAGSPWWSSWTASACWGRTRPSSTAATSATTSGSGSRTPGARSPSRRRWSCRWATGGRRSTRPVSSGSAPACPSMS